MSLISTAVTCVPHGSVCPSNTSLNLLVDARGIRKKLIKAKSSNNIAHRRLADLIDRVVDVLNRNHRFLRIGDVIVGNGRDVD